MAFVDLAPALLDFIFPPRTTTRVVRGLSLAELQAIILRGEWAGSLPYHDPRVTALVWEVKYYANRHAAALGGAILADLLLDLGSDMLGLPLVVPVPMHDSRRRTRGHNQTELLCQAALKQLSGREKVLEKKSGGYPRTFLRASFSKAGFEYAPTILVRTRNTPQQQGLARHTRLANIKDSMRVINPKCIKGRSCIVVDDVSTTGATLAEAKRALLAAGAGRVECIALAHS